MYTTKVSPLKSAIAIISNYVPPKNNWRDQAACKDAAVGVFFPAATTPTRTQLLAAYTYCKNCPVAAYCMHEALLCSHHGIWAHSTQAQRKYFLKLLSQKGVEDITLEIAESFYKELCSNDEDFSKKIVRKLYL